MLLNTGTGDHQHDSRGYTKICTDSGKNNCWELGDNIPALLGTDRRAQDTVDLEDCMGFTSTSGECRLWGSLGFTPDGNPGSDGSIGSFNCTSLLPIACISLPDADPDGDGDGIADDDDNCPTIVNSDQADGDSDGQGDACDVCPADSDNDSDGDGICGNEDNCPLTSNADQFDNDSDGDGDVCDNDDDNDGIFDESDNCWFDANSDQSDTDGDGIGNVCDTDDDSDNVLDADDACPNTPLGEIVDAIGCSIDELCPCDNEWKNHGAYVSCVAHTAEDFIDAGLITEAEKDIIVSAAGHSDCGKKNK